MDLKEEETYYKNLYEQQYGYSSYSSDNIYLPNIYLEEEYNPQNIYSIFENTVPQNGEENVQNYWDYGKVNENDDFYTLFTQESFNDQWQNKWNNLPQEEQNELEKLLLTMNEESQEKTECEPTIQKSEDKLSENEESELESLESSESPNQELDSHFESKEEVKHSIYNFPNQEQINEWKNVQEYTWINYKTRKEINEEFSRVNRDDETNALRKLSQEELRQRILDLSKEIIGKPTPRKVKRRDGRNYCPNILYKIRIFEIFKRQKWENIRRPKIAEVSKVMSEIWKNERKNLTIEEIKGIYTKMAIEFKEKIVGQQECKKVIKRRKIKPTFLTQEC